MLTILRPSLFILLGCHPWFEWWDLLTIIEPQDRTIDVLGMLQLEVFSVEGEVTSVLDCSAEPP